MGRVVGIDFGLKRIGIAISDPSKKIATPLCTVASSVQEVCKALESRKKEIEAIVIGLPLLLNGQEADLAKQVRQFGEKLHGALLLPIFYIDERLTSKAAEQGLKEMQLSRKKRTKILDSGAAALLLQTYLDQR